MPDREKVILALEYGLQNDSITECSRIKCPFLNCRESCLEWILRCALALLKEQDPRVLTLDEVIAHYSLPPVFVDDFDEQEDYLEDIKPLYFDYLDACTWYVHWRGYYSARTYIDGREASYGVTWRCWTDKPTDEQREVVKWDAPTD